MKKLFFTLIFMIFALTAFSQNSSRDVVYLKNGSIIKGQIIEQIPELNLKLETSDGSILVYEMNEVKRISKEKIPPSSGNNSNFLSAISKGKFSISGSTSLSFTSMTNEVSINSEFFDDKIESDINQFSFQPSVSYFVADGFAIGLSIEYETLKQEGDDSEQKESSLLAGPIITYYFGTSNIKPFIHGEYMFGNETYEYDGDESSYKKEGWALGGGVAFFLNQYISLDLGIGYANMSGDMKESDYDIESTRKGLTINGGISVYF
ncbi:outer membrane protein [Marinilabilia rubra]|uniref:Outer membrane protein beta-barrel domain-containing protein n=1 Tax=Marinilabilia rubra TaxID=2162893 RepID=A0A2U2B7V5_9BACT|nr:outer membrane beta-barrel protein [Marinilabilia rubra]PWD99132.1 hypothetical protein DDZ16_11045 [Marinilabilia rubra]